MPQKSMVHPQIPLKQSFWAVYVSIAYVQRFPRTQEVYVSTWTFTCRMMRATRCWERRWEQKAGAV